MTYFGENIYPDDVTGIGRLQKYAYACDLNTLEEIVEDARQNGFYDIIVKRFYENDMHGVMPLMYAAKSGLTETFKFIWNIIGDKRRYTDIDNKTVLHYAAYHGHADLINFIVTSMAKGSVGSKLALVDGKSYFLKMTPLMMAAKTKSSDAIHALVINHNADCKLKNHYGQTALDIYLKSGGKDAQTVTLLNR